MSLLQEQQVTRMRFRRLIPYVSLSVAFLAIGMSVDPVKQLYRRNWSSTSRLLLFMRSETGSTRIAKLMMRYAEEYELDPIAFMAVIWQESRFNVNAHAKRPEGYMGAGDDDRGLGGLYWRTAEHIVKTQWNDKDLARQIRNSPAVLYEPDLNLSLTAANLRRLLDDHESVHDMWDAYAYHNAGDNGKGSLENVAAVKNRYFHYQRKLAKFDWRSAR